jgi:hypothetical protein
MSKDNDYKVMSIRIAMNQYREIREIVDEHVAGMLNDSDFARRAFASYISAIKAEYAKANRGPGRPKLSQQDLVARKIEEKRQSEALKAETLKAEAELICEELEGTVREENGTKYCAWKTYEQIGAQVAEGELEVPFEMLTRTHVKDQYRPTREAVEAIKTP